jgi:hypothetical protein
MITRAFTKGDAESEAVYSDCENYRFLLTRTWGDGPRALFIMLNPSTATEFQNDPTVERCERRARALGYGAFRVTNIFAWRATDPRDMRAAPDPVGAENDRDLRLGQSRGASGSGAQGRGAAARRRQAAASPWPDRAGTTEAPAIHRV